MLRIPNRLATSPFSSTLTLATVARPAISPASCSSDGAIILQGPHHAAQKSTSTGPLTFLICSSKLSSVRVRMPLPAIGSPRSLEPPSPVRAHSSIAPEMAANAAHPRPRKRFGQHFLADSGAIRRIVAALGPAPGPPVVEIGPGRVALTGPLLDAFG